MDFGLVWLIALLAIPVSLLVTTVGRNVHQLNGTFDWVLRLRGHKLYKNTDVWWDVLDMSPHETNEHILWFKMQETLKKIPKSWLWDHQRHVLELKILEGMFVVSMNSLKKKAEEFASYKKHFQNDEWRQILGVDPDVTDIEVVRKARKKAAMKAHPDRGGSDEQMQRINTAWEAAQQALS